MPTKKYSNKEKLIIDRCRQYAIVHGIHYNQLTDDLVLYAIRETETPTASKTTK